LKDFKAISKTYYSKFKSRLGKKTEYGKRFKEDFFGIGFEFQYERMFYSKPLSILDFINFVNTKSQINSILEIGCSTGMFTKILPELFKNKKYVGIDISQKAIDICKQNSDFEFICADFLKINTNKKYD
jgi:predicted TPR repeat methyltransferase